MKKLLVVLVLVAVSFIGVQSAMALIAGSKHDLSTTAAGGTTEICVFCHTPHGADVAKGPIWNRSAADPTYTMYSIQSSTTADAVDGTSLSPQSRACMTCHDGVTAMNSLLNGPGNPDVTVNIPNGAITGDAAIGGGAAGNGGDLSNDHPVGVIYDTLHASLRNPTGDAVDTVKLIATTTVQGQNAVSKIQCESCHSDVHGTVNQSLFTRINAGQYGNINSSMCLGCHQK